MGHRALSRQKQKKSKKKKKVILSCCAHASIISEERTDIEEMEGKGRRKGGERARKGEKGGKCVRKKIWWRNFLFFRAQSPFKTKTKKKQKKKSDTVVLRTCFNHFGRKDRYR